MNKMPKEIFALKAAAKGRGIKGTLIPFT